MGNDGQTGRRGGPLSLGGGMLFIGGVSGDSSSFFYRRGCSACGAGIAHRPIEGRPAPGQPGGPDSRPARAGNRGGPRSVSVAAGTGPAEPADLLVPGGGVSSGNPGTAGVGGYAAGETVFVPHTSANRGSAPGHQGWIAAPADHVAL